MSKENPVPEEELTPSSEPLPNSAACTEDGKGAKLDESISQPSESVEVPDAADAASVASTPVVPVVPVAAVATAVSGGSVDTMKHPPMEITEDSAPRWDPEPTEPTKRAIPEEELPTQEELTAKLGIAARSFDLCAAIGPLVLLVLWAVQSLPVLLGRELRALYTFASSSYDCLFTSLQASMPTGAVPAATDTFVLPVFGWFLAGLGQIPGLATLPGLFPEYISDPSLVPVAASLATLLLVLLTWALARATGNNAQTAFAAGLVVLAGLTFIGLPAFAGDALLFAAILTLASLCLYRGWIKTFAPLWLCCGFLCVALATLTGGLAGLLLPLLVSLLFLLWRCTFRRGGARDGALSFGLMLIVLCVWGTSVAFSDGGRDQLANLLSTTVIMPFQEILRLQGRELLLALPVLALLSLPWVLVILFLPWERLGVFFGNIVRNRTQRPGQGWIWWFVLAGIVVLGLLGAGDPLYLLPLLPPLAILAAQGILSLSAGRNKAFILLLSVLLFLLGMLFAIANVYPLLFDAVPPVLAALHPATLSLEGQLVEVGVFIVFALLLWKGVNRASANGSLLMLTVLAVILAAPLAWYASPVSVAVSQPATQTAPAVTPEALLPSEASEQQTPAEMAPQPAAPTDTSKETSVETPQSVPEGTTAAPTPQATPESAATPATLEAAPAPAITDAEKTDAIPTPVEAPVETPASAPADTPAEAPAETAPANSHL